MMMGTEERKANRLATSAGVAAGREPSSRKVISTENLLAVITNVVALTALLISCFSIIYSHEEHTDAEAGSAIREQYQLFLDLEKLLIDEPYLVHMIALPEDYDEIKNQVKLATSQLPEQEKEALFLKERAFVIYLHSIFEHAFYQLQHAKRFDDEKRFIFYQEVLDAFTGRLLRNPRLLYFWNCGNGAISSYLERDSRKYYNEKVLEARSEYLNIHTDADGPFLETNP